MNKEDKEKADLILKDIEADVLQGRFKFSLYRFKQDLLWTATKLEETHKELEAVSDKCTNLEDDLREALLKIEQLEGNA